MPIIVGVRFGESRKIYYFNPIRIDFEVGDGVIVETARGQEFAKIGIANKFVEESEIVPPLRDVIRKATDADVKRAAENRAMSVNALEVCQRNVNKHKLKMKLVDAEYTFDRSKVIFNFTADERVDFRELVKDLAGEMHMRIELRQIYERDDIKRRGALGMCGRPCCCSSFLGEYEKASVKMAKNQNLSLNPTKISGMCGKLMCCLKFENDFYVNMQRKMPKLYSTVKTRDGMGKVEAIDILRERIKVDIVKDDGFEVKYFNVGEFEMQGGQNNYDGADSKEDDIDEIKE